MQPTDAFDLDPVLSSATLGVRPVHADDFEALYAVAADPLVWAQHPARQRHERPVFTQWFADALVQHALVVTDLTAQRVVGSSRLYNWDAARREVAIGFTFLGRAYWGGATNAQLKHLMLDHAFRWAEAVWFHVDPANTRSRKAMEKIGGREVRTARLSICGAPSAEYVFYRIDRAAWQIS